MKTFLKIILALAIIGALSTLIDNQAGAISYPVVDLKVNGSDSTVYLSSPASYTVSWTSSNAQSCSASGAWSGTKSLNGAEGFSGMPNNTYVYSLTCWNGTTSNSDTIQVVVQSGAAAYLSLVKLGRNLTQGLVWANSINANPGDLLEFSLDVYVNGSGTSYGTYARDVLPSYLDFTEGSVRVDGLVSSDSLVSSGLFLGDLSQGTHKQIVFSATVMSGMPLGTTILVNSGRVWANGLSEVSDPAEVVVYGGGTGSATLALQKSVRDISDPNTPSGTYLENVNTLPGRELEFSLGVLGASNVSYSVMVHDTLPAGLTYVSGSTTIDGSSANDGIVAGGLNIGTVNPGQTKIVKFRATVRENAYFTSFVTKLTNTSSVKGSNNVTEVSDLAYIWVTKTGRVLGATDIDTGVDLGLLSALMASGMSALGLSGFQVGRKAYWRNKISQLRKAA
jgi:uncharacterized repeat protein (TIGR01451 family)